MSKYLYYFVGVIGLITLVFLVLFIRDISSNKSLDQLGDCTPYNIELNDLKSDSVKIIWRTKAKCTGIVKYGEERDNIVFVASETNDSSAKMEHQVILENLKYSSNYYVLVVSNGKEYGSSGNPVSFKTKE